MIIEVEKDKLITLRNSLLKQSFAKKAVPEYREGYTDGILDLFNSIRKISEIKEVANVG